MITLTTWSWARATAAKARAEMGAAKRMMNKSVRTRYNGKR